MSENILISSWVSVRDAIARLNRSVFFQRDRSGRDTFVKDLYKQLDCDYPKFYKMDGLSRLAFVAAELLLKDESLKNKYNADEIALVFSNASASLETDKTYFASVENKSNYF